MHAAAAQFPRDCCRCGSHDAHGDSAEAGCLGKHRVAKGKRRFVFGLEQEKLDSHFLKLVHVELEKDGARLPDGVSEEQLGRQLRDEVVPVRAVDTPRVCRPCWQAAERDRLPAALQRLKQALRQPDREESADSALGAVAGAAAGAAAQPYSVNGPVNAKRQRVTAFVPSLDDSCEDAPAQRVKWGAAASAQASESGEEQQVCDLQQRVVQLEEAVRTVGKKRDKQAEKAQKWKSRQVGDRVKNRPGEEQLRAELQQKDSEIADLQAELRHVEAERDIALDVARSVDKLLRDEEDAEQDAEPGGPPSRAPGTLEGLSLNLVGKGATGKPRLLERYRDVIVELSELYHVAQEKVLGCLLMVLRATGLTVECSVTDSDEQLVQAVAETGELLKQQLTHDLVVAQDPEFVAPDVEQTFPDSDDDTPMLARPRADEGPVEAVSGEWREQIAEKIREWTEKHNQEKGELVDMPEDARKLESYRDFNARHPGYSDAELRDLFKGLGCAGYALYVDDTKKFNLRNQSSILISGVRLTDAGKPRVFALTELFGKGGATGDLDEILTKMEEQRQRMQAHGQQDVGKLMYLYVPCVA